MKALIVYVLLVCAGDGVAALVGTVIEKNISSTFSLIFFLLMFFANFVICWLATILIMDGTLKKRNSELPPLPGRA